MTNDEKIKERIKRLLAMADDKSSPNEAAIALKRARSLADKHQMSLDDITTDDLTEIVYPGFTGMDGTAPPWISTLAYGSCQLNDCVLFVRKHPDSGDVFFIFAGLQQDVELACWFCDYLQESLSSAWQDASEIPDAFSIDGTINAADYRDGYCATLARRIAKVMEERNATNEKEEKKKPGKNSKQPGNKGMIALKQTLVEQKFGKTKMKSARMNPAMNPIAIAMGQAAAEQVNLNQKAIQRSE